MATQLSRVVFPTGDSANTIPYVEGTGTTAGQWLGELDGLTEYYDGLLILYKIPIAGAATTTLNINNIGAATCYYNGTTKLTTHYPVNQPILLVYSSTLNSGSWVSLNDYTVSNTNTVGEYGGSCVAGTNGIPRYNLAMQTKLEGTIETWEGLVLTSSTSTSKSKNPSGFIVGSPVIYVSGATYAEGDIVGEASCWCVANSINLRYSTNGGKSTTVAGRPFFIKGTINPTDGLFYLADTWWADDFPTTNDGFYYIYVGQASGAYVLTLYPTHPIYYYDNGLKILLNGTVTDAQTVNGHTVNKDVPSDAVFTDTDTKVTQTSTSTNADYEVLFSGTADDTTRTEGVRKDSNLLYNPSSNTLGVKTTGISNSITPSSISLSNSSGGSISIDNTNNQIEVGKSGTSITYSNTDVVTSNGNTWDGTNTSLKDAIANIIDLLHPVGSIYMSLTDSTVAEVEAKFGGTWEKIEDRFLLAASSSYTVDSTGGSADAVVVSHTHPLNGTNAKTSDQAAHTHPLNGTNAKAVDVGGHTHTEYAGINEATSGLFTSITGTRSYPNTHIIGGSGKTSSNGGHGHSLTGNTSTGGAHSHTLSGNTGAASDGVSGTGKNMPPYLAVYMYKRTA